jgi:hypothetical protein
MGSILAKSYIHAQFILYALLHILMKLIRYVVKIPTLTIRLIKKIKVIKQIIFAFLYLGMDGVQCKDMFFI